MSAPPYLAEHRYGQVTDQIAALALDRPMRWRWRAAFAVAVALFALLLVSIGVLLVEGIGVWGINRPGYWGLAIADYVWWIGLGNAGTLISAALLLLQQDWRNSLNRFAEAMTLFAVFAAAIHPILHLGRPWFFYWTLPYPNTMGMWPQFRSPLTWDVSANAIYLLVSALFFYVGLIPDLASVRDRAKGRWGRGVYGLLALGWRGSAAHWVRWRAAYRLLAALSIPLVFLVHSGVAMLFAGGPQAGWHTTIFPPYFVMGAMFSGFAVIAMLSVVLRGVFKLDRLITERHLDTLGKVLLFSGLITAYGYLFEAFGAWYAGGIFERQTLMDRLVGSHALVYWLAVIPNFVPLQLLWWRSIRTNPYALFAIGLSVTVGMWFERYMLLVSTIERGFLPAAWGDYTATVWDWSFFAGTLGLFLLLFLLFLRFVPMISIFEVKEVVRHERREGG